MADNISIDNISKQNGFLYFNIQNINISLINALRRIIISDIPCYVFRTYPYEKNNVNIIKNTCRINNEVIKQRLSCVPIHIKENSDINENIDNLVFEINKKNEENHTIYITTNDFKIKDNQTNTYLSDDEVQKIFPPDPISNDHIIITRLRPKISNEIQGEEIHIEAKIILSSAKEDSAFNMVSTCSYQNIGDKERQNEEWIKKETQLRKSNLSDEELEFEKKNWYLLDAQRIFRENSFKFILESVGVYENEELIIRGCNILNNKLNKIIELCNNETLEVKTSETLMNGLDIILQNEDYTIGKSLEYALNELFYDNIMDFIGFRKFHPHDNFSIIRVSYTDNNNNISLLYSHIKEACNHLIQVFSKIKLYFE